MIRTTLELRWFMEGDVPAAVTAWFDGLGRAPEAQPARTDLYLRPTDASLNVKVREGRLEIKRRLEASGLLDVHADGSGCVERWRKWSFALATDAADFVDADAAWIPVRKARWLRLYDVADGRSPVAVHGFYPERGCALELARVEAVDRNWWSLCFEAFAPTGPLTPLLQETARAVFTRGTPPRLDPAHSVGYPEWLMGVEGRHAAGAA